MAERLSELCIFFKEEAVGLKKKIFHDIFSEDDHMERALYIYTLDAQKGKSHMYWTQSGDCRLALCSCVLLPTFGSAIDLSIVIIISIFKCVAAVVQLFILVAKKITNQPTLLERQEEP